MKILGISGKKQSGKNVTSNFILGMHLLNNGIVRGSFNITPDGQLYVSDIFGADGTEGVLNQDYSSDDMWNWFRENVWPLVKVYSFADPLKRLCIDVLGLSPAQCYGSDADKNTETHLRWKDMQGLGVLNLSPQDTVCGPEKETEYMTAREVLQYVGTNIFRKIYDTVWVDATIRQIQIEQPQIAIINDVRFPNEVKGIQDVGGKVVRLTRAPHIEDEHSSEVALDKEKFDWKNFDAIIDNAEMTIAKQNESVYNILRPLGYLPKVQEN